MRSLSAEISWQAAFALLVCTACGHSAREAPAAPATSYAAPSAQAAPSASSSGESSPVDELSTLADGSRFPPDGQCSRELVEALLRRSYPYSSGATLPAPSTGSELLPTSCADATRALRQQALAEMRSRLEQTRDSYLLRWCGHPRPKMKVLIEASEEGPVPGAAQISRTNNQVSGVDEADFIKNDAGFLYAAARGKVQIFDIWPPEGARPVSQISDVADPRKLLLDGDRLVVLSSESRAADRLGEGRGEECTYGYDCAFGGDGTATGVTLFDVSDRKAPKRLRELRLSGSLISARAIGSVVHIVVHDEGVSVPGLRFQPSDPGKTPRAAFDAFERLRLENEAVIDGMTPEQMMPDVVERGPGSGPTRASEPCIAYGPTRPSTSFVSLVSLDTRARSGFSRTIVASRPGPIYVSPTALYLAIPENHAEGVEWVDETVVHAFDLRGATSRYAASGSVKGRVLNQFAMDEHDGRLRVAATTGRPPDPMSHTTVTVLERAGSTLNGAGVLDHLATGEDIRSVRFQDDRAFVVTFKKTDPLFVLDLSRPSSPKVLGELKVPGFSTYMHFLDDKHLLTVGFDADDKGDFAWFTGVLLQVFDVTRPTHPSLLHRTVIGTRGTSSQALTDHLGFTYFAPKRLLALPITVCEGDWQGAPNAGGTPERTFSGLMVYDVSVARGFRLRTKVSHEKLGADGATRTWNDPGCSTWWSRSTSYVKRSIVADDCVFSISSDEIRISDLRNRRRKLPILSFR